MKCGDFVNKKQISVGLALLVGIFALNVFSFFNIRNMNHSMNNLKNQINEVNGSLDSSLDNISENVSASLQKEASLINNFRYEFGKMKEGKIDLIFIVNPKEISDESEYSFSYSIDDEEKIVDGIIDGASTIIATTVVPIDSSVEVNFIIKNGDKRKIENLGYWSSFESVLIEAFNFENINNGMSLSHSDNKVSFDGVGFSINFDASYVNQYDNEKNRNEKSLDGIKIFVAVNGKTKDSFDMEKSDDSTFSSMKTYHYIFEKYSLTLKPKDKLEVYALADHEDGYKVRINLDTISIDKKSL